MVHTLPDGTTKYRMTKIFGQIDQGELAARQWSPNVFDRRGDTVFMDDFRDGMVHWKPEGDGTGWDNIVTSAQAAFGDKCIKQVGGSNGLRVAKLSHYHYLPVDARIGVEFWLNFGLDSDEYDAIILYYTGKVRLRAWVHIDILTNDLDVETTGGAFPEIDGDLHLVTNSYLFYPVKVVVDYKTGKYVRLLFGNTQYDVSAYSLRSDDDVVTNPMIIVQLVAKSTAGNNGYTYLDNVIITQNEP